MAMIDDMAFVAIWQASDDREQVLETLKRAYPSSGYTMSDVARHVAKLRRKEIPLKKFPKGRKPTPEAALKKLAGSKRKCAELLEHLVSGGTVEGFLQG